MKKFTKGCLMTALVLFIIGFVLCIVCGLLGGFRQLSEMDGIGGIPFRYHRDASGDWEIGFFDSEESEKNREQLALTADTLGSLEIDVEDCNVIIRESSDEFVWFLAEGNSNRPYYTIEDEGKKSRLCVENEVEHHLGHWRKGPNDTAYLWLPKGCALEEYEVNLGAGYMQSISIKARQTEVDLGAGLIEADGFEGEEISLSVGAGEILSGRIAAETAVLQIGAGHLSIEELSANRNADIDVGMGQCEIAGTITGDLDLECSMGEAVLHLTGSEDDHSYDVDCGMGNVTVGSYSRGGVAAQKTWNTGKNSAFDIDCSMGDVTVTFEE